jgi:ubiquinone/menaquinone biosynthesis C-methylase UbiE
VKRVAHTPELLDGPLDRRVLAGNLRDLARANRLLGGAALSRRAVAALIRGRHAPSPREGGAKRPEPVQLLDVGTGAADIPAELLAWAGRKRIPLTIVAVDSRDEVVELAAQRVGPRADLRVEVASGERLPFESGSFDIAHASLVLHHLEPDDAVRLLGEMARVSRTGIVVNDLDRTRRGWLGAWLVSHLLTRNRYSRHDASLSVRRAYRPSQVAQLAARAGLVEVRRHNGFAWHRYALTFVHAGPVRDRGSDVAA